MSKLKVKTGIKPEQFNYQVLIENIGDAIHRARENAIRSINFELVKSNWEIGKHIIEFEQKGSEKADYGSALLTNLSKDLKSKYGKGYSKSNLYLCRLFYIKYPIFQTVSGKLSWSHYAELITVTNDNAREFYEKEAIKGNLSFRELKRQIDSALFERLALSKNKKEILLLAKKGHDTVVIEDALKDPYVFEFLGLPKKNVVNEKQLENRLLENLQDFLLELGKGFTFVAKQFKITIDNHHYYVDLVFYHRILKCFVLIELKTRKVKHQDIGQLNLYLNYFKDEESEIGDNDPIGIIIAADKHELLVKYATGGMSNKIFVSKYQLYLPDQRVLEQKLKELMDGYN